MLDIGKCIVFLYINSSLFEYIMEIKIKFKRNLLYDTLKKKLNEKLYIYIMKNFKCCQGTLKRFE